MHGIRASAILGGLLAAVALPAATRLYDFETREEVGAWTTRTPDQVKLALASSFATSGQAALEIDAPAYRAGLDRWQSFEARPALTDWSGADRLLLDVTNVCAERFFFAVHLYGAEPNARPFQYELPLPARTLSRFLVPLTALPGDVKLGAITKIHFFGEDPQIPFKVYVDNLVLLAPGEQPPPLPAGLLAPLRDLRRQDLDAAKALLEPARAKAATLEAGSPGRASADGTLDAAAARIAAMRRECEGAETTLEKLGAFGDEAAALPAQLERLSSIVALAADCAAAGRAASPMLVGVASSADKVLPREKPLAVAAARALAVAVARNEKESFQLIVVPLAGALKSVTLAASDLRAESGATFPRANVACEVVGYVKTVKRPPYDAPYVGWWPDPILDFLGPIDIAPGDAQAFWVRVRAAKDQAPGEYRGTLTVAADSVAPVVLELRVAVRAFTLPDVTPLPTAITFVPPEFAEYIPNVICGGAEKWRALKLVWADFLADYYMEFDSLYRRAAPDFEILEHRHEKGTLRAFNFGYFTGDSAQNLAAFKPTYEKAKQLGLLEHAYIYGFDECNAEQFPALETAAKALTQAFPEVPVMTTSYDQSYGQDTVVKSVDGWCPLSSVFNPDKAAKARAAGKMVWWYICCGPHHPFANWFVEYPGIEIRLLMGAMTAKYRPDGFLYYSTAFWNDNKPITSGPFTQWNPVSWTTYHGDGSIMCAGPGGKPVPTIRLENYRDGQEDFAYVRILEEIIARYEAKDGALDEKERAWLEAAKLALTVPEDVVKAMNDYSRDFAKLQAWRNRIAECIDASGMADADPWAKNTGVRVVK
jgi:hypothetical protein